jgi:hypothetical protein
MAEVAPSDPTEFGLDTLISALYQMLTLHPLANPWHAMNKTGYVDKGHAFVGDFGVDLVGKYLEHRLKEGAAVMGWATTTPSFTIAPAVSLRH